MEKEQNKWREIICKPFAGQNAFTNFFIAFTVLWIIKVSLRSIGIGLGIFISTPLLLIIAWIVGYLPELFTKLFNKTISADKAKINTTQTLFNKKDIILPIFTLIFFGFIALGAYYYNQLQKREINCLKKIDYLGTTKRYRIKELGDYRFFKTQDEAMNYCLKVLR